MNVILFSRVLMRMMMVAVAVMRDFVLIVCVTVMRVRMVRLVRMSRVGVPVVCVVVMVVMMICMRMAVRRVMVVVRLRRAPALRQQEHSHS
jgi:hypothetical protein